MFILICRKDLIEYHTHSIRFEYRRGGERFFPKRYIWKAILSRRSFHEYQLRVLKNMHSLRAACVSHAHLPEENFLFELTVNATHTAHVRTSGFPPFAGRLRDPFVVYLRYKRKRWRANRFCEKTRRNKVRH